MSLILLRRSFRSILRVPVPMYVCLCEINFVMKLVAQMKQSISM